MSQLGNDVTSFLVKLLLLGNSGVGKTGALGSLAEAGYRIFLYDFDNGHQILLDSTVLKPEFRKNVFVKVFTDKLKDAKGTVDGMPTAFPHFIDNLNAWREIKVPGKPAVLGPDGKTVVSAAVPPVVDDLGNPGTWGPKDIVVIDSLTFMGHAALRYVLFLNNHIGKPPQLQHWGEAIRMQEDVIARLYAEQVKCNVIILGHLMPLEDANEGGIVRLWPSALGKKFPPKIGRYFNNVWEIKKKVMGQKIMRTLHTSATFQSDLKSTKPGKMPTEMEVDLAKAFTILQTD